VSGDATHAGAELPPGDPSAVIRDLGGDVFRLRCPCGAVFERSGKGLRRNAKTRRPTTCDRCIARRLGAHLRRGGPGGPPASLTREDRIKVERLARDDDRPAPAERLRRLVPRAPEVEAAIAAGTVTRDQAQGRRFRGARKRTVPIRHVAPMRRELPVLPPDVQRPQTRGECENAERPCPWVGCKWHAYLDVTDTGSIVLNFPDVDPESLDRLPYSCVLDVADHGGAILEDVGAVMNLTRERVRQIEAQALRRLRARPYARENHDHH
jgi:Sigma-70, region 4